MGTALIGCVMSSIPLHGLHGKVTLSTGLQVRLLGIRYGVQSQPRSSGLPVRLRASAPADVTDVPCPAADVADVQDSSNGQWGSCCGCGGRFEYQFDRCFCRLRSFKAKYAAGVGSDSEEVASAHQNQTGKGDSPYIANEEVEGGFHTKKNAAFKQVDADHCQTYLEQAVDEATSRLQESKEMRNWECMAFSKAASEVRAIVDKQRFRALPPHIIEARLAKNTLPL